MIYFDNNATTQIAPAALAAMKPFLDEGYGNPNSSHQEGTRARAAVERARVQTAKALGVNASEIVFTGSGSEADNHAVLGPLWARGEPGKNLVISAVEHPAVRVAAEWAAAHFGFELRVAPIRLADDGVDAAPFLDLIDRDTLLVSVMYANNETGVVLPIQEIFAAAGAVGATRHTDAVQALGKLPINPKALGADLLTIAGHKIHGPKGVGALYIRRGVAIEPLIHGGGQESGRRAGTENTAQIVGFGAAVELAVQPGMDAVRALRDRFEAELDRRFGDRAVVNFQTLPRTPNTSSVQFPGQDAALLLIKLDRRGICVSTGSACNSGSLKASSVLTASGLSEKAAAATLRFSFSRMNTEAEVDKALDALEDILAKGKRRADVA